MRGQVRRKGLQCLGDLHLTGLLDAGAFQQDGQRTHVVRAEDHVDPGGLGHDEVTVLLGHATTHGDLHAGVLLLEGGHPAEVPVQPVVGVLPHGAGVEDHHVGRADLGVLVRRQRHISGLVEQAGDPLGVMGVHLASVGDHPIAARGRAGGIDGWCVFGLQHGRSIVVQRPRGIPTRNLRSPRCARPIVTVALSFTHGRAE